MDILDIIVRIATGAIVGGAYTIISVWALGFIEVDGFRIKRTKLFMFLFKEAQRRTAWQRRYRRKE